METTLELNEKRQELKDEITAGINKTPMARLFNVTRSVVQKITRSQKPLPALYCTALLAPIVLMPVLFYMILFHESQIAAEISLFSVITVLEVMLLSVILTYFNINRVLLSIRDILVDSIILSKDLSDLRKWLAIGWSSSVTKSFLIWWNTILVGIVTYIFYVLEHGYLGFGLFIFLLIFIFLGGMAWYYVPLMLLLPMKLKFFQFDLYENDPAHSEIIESISAVLNRFTYGFVFINILVQLGLATTNFPIVLEFGFLVVLIWIPLVAQFFINQASIQYIISVSKRKTLNRIQMKIKTLHNSDIADKDNIDIVNRLMDYHERIRLTSNSNLSLESALKFLNQLIIPLLAFLLGNLEKVIAFLH